MIFHVLQAILQCLIVNSLAFEDFIYVYADGNKEMAEQGRVQYQIIKERGTLPKYGPCWKGALEHLNEGCRSLSEDTQSDIALHITNCFLELSGHQTYNCELDKKPNLRGICINSMSDRAFNVYTEFYTHTQNICWFLRGQIWHETIAENTLKVGKQLEMSAEHQQELIRIQKESIDLQERMLKQGRFLEKVLEDVYVSTQAHQDILKVLTQSVTSLQTWVVGEISWIDSIIFNVTAIFLIFIITSSPRTLQARFPLFFLLFLNLAIERLICTLYTKYTSEQETHNLYSNIYNFVWYTRYAFTFLAAVFVVFSVITYHDINKQNQLALDVIKKQNNDILKSFQDFRRSKTPSVSTASVDFITENDTLKTHNSKMLKSRKLRNGYERLERESSTDSAHNFNLSRLNSNYSRRNVLDLSGPKYMLRSQSRQGTPDSGVVH
ncbi:hypothetical protein ABEB36_008769 [Hypothenemus hampei]|uniref:Uncharacterized protein n=1 Tax=Hypothenemus hampei TaxID=57062 RepID=A0ABD1EN06_HYPHA